MDGSPIWFRADGTTKIGLGHLMRCLAIASYLPQPTALAVREPGKAIKKLLKGSFDQMVVMRTASGAAKFASYLKPGDLVIMDGYAFKPPYQQTLLDAGAKLICIDDTALHPYLGHAVINHGGGLQPSGFQLASHTKLYLGPKYAMLRMPFLEAALQPRTFSKVDTVFLALGGSDPQNYTLEVLKNLASIKHIRQLNVVIGAANLNRIGIEQFAKTIPHLQTKIHHSLSAEEMVSLLQSCQVAITPASTMSYEAACVGMGLIILQTADNQARIHSFLQKEGMAFGLDPDQDMGDLVKSVEELVSNPSLIGDQVENQRAQFDGRSPERIRDIVQGLR